MPKQQMRIAICGAGVGGLTLALTLGIHSEHHVDLYEAGAEISTIGAGISVWARTFEVLQLLGLHERMRERGISLDSVDQQRTGPKFRRSDQAHAGYNFLTDAISSAFMYRFNILKSWAQTYTVVEGGLTMHRPDLIDLLKDHLPLNCSVHLRKRMTSYTTSSSGSALIKMHFADGTTATVDVLVGADGVRSATRETMFGALANQYKSGFDGISHERLLRCKDPVWTGTVAYRCVYPAEKLRKVNPGHPGLDDQIIAKTALVLPATPCQPLLTCCPLIQHIVSYPIARRTLINFIGFDTIPGAEDTRFPDKWVQDVPVKEFRDLYRGWEPDMQTLLNCADTPSRWAIHVTAPLPFYAHGNVALLGDAVRHFLTDL
ncbi:FAD/NAD(P)-binding domain-containing protein [Mycena venus]|uniref:FAD/NAD(P)-binding domain-containing protein n=1 Tax=Mycena venus TaxID=2733690 RepID=A0A8H7D0N7_9AGAR|nr:FAD/NAD(P)-binding domain-containing protein [Mycena venus]